MPTFQYQVRSRNGQMLSGKIDSASMRDAVAKLRDDGYYITSIQPVGAFAKNVTTSSSKKRSMTGKVKLRDLLLFTRQFAVLIKAGVNLSNCLKLLVQQTENAVLAEVITKIQRDVEGGEALHVAIGRHPKVFPGIYVSMIEAGEASGQLDTVLLRLTEHFEREFELKRKIVGAITYPAVIACVAIIAVGVLMTFVIPNFMNTFKENDLELPWLTKMLMVVSDFMVAYWWLILAIIIAIIFGFFKFKETPKGRQVVDKFFYDLPVVGPVIQKVASARFARTLSTLLDSGVLITTSMEIVERAVGNTVIANAVGQARLNVTRGTGIATPLADLKVFPGLVTQMISVGEETGELSNMLNQIADFYEKESAYAIEGLTSLIEPTIIILMGGVVGLIVAAIIIPMFDMTKLAM